ncbi:hypothetical protein [Mesorhizobium sp. A623]
MTITEAANTAQAATLTEMELFGHFKRMQITHNHSFGGTILEYSPEESLRECGGYGGVGDFSDQFADELERDDQQEETLDCMISDLESYLDNLRLVRSDFQSFKAIHLIMPEEPADDTDRAAYKAWECAAIKAEKNPRYRPVIIASAAQEAA